MSTQSPSEGPIIAAATELQIDLRNPALAALLAWLWPGAGHLYQRRYGKGALFMVCILTTYFFGLIVGGGKVVHMSFNDDANRARVRKPRDLIHRWPFPMQFCVGASAFPALVQYWRVRSGAEPLIADVMAPPSRFNEEERPEARDRLASWHERYHVFFSIGELYTVVAGLLNVLAIYDAFAGPVIGTPEEEKEKPDDQPQPQPAT